MDEFPTPDEEFELMYQDELELLHEQSSALQPSQQSSNQVQLTQSTCAPSVSQDLFESILSQSQEAPTTNKRTIEELFGDIDDILYESQSHSKRHKSDDTDAENALIDHIIELRRLARQKDIPQFLRNESVSVVNRDKNNLSLTVPKYPFIGLTRHDGDRVYVRFHSEQYEIDEREALVQQISLAEGAGSNKQIWNEAQKLIEKQLHIDDDSLQVTGLSISEKDLWVDLYKPRKYVELLSDESTNRIMLRWMKLWDKIVFKRRPKVRIVKSNDKSKFKALDLCTELDETGRPKHKVTLLCGPPGLGKTTLAHMVARHAGYNVVEINASDDRSIDVFKTALNNATQMQSVLDTERRPNCLVFDEIDGAPPSSIDYLVKFVTGTRAKSKKAAQESGLLRRPIICICNDVYVPALRALRQIAFVVNFPATSTMRLAERLVEIARRQQIKTDLGAMMAMAEKSHNDIRSCLSVLQFFKSQNKPVTLSDVHKVGVGQKDIHKGLFAVWQDIFLIERNKQSRDNINFSLKERMDKILNVVSSFGDYEKVSHGIFENYPNMKYKSLHMDETCYALDWFSYNDIINQRIYSLQNYSLMNYLQYAFVAWHYTFSSRTWQKIQYHNVSYEVRTRQTRQKAIISELMRGVRPIIRSYVQPIFLTLDILPMLRIIIVPSFRPISLHLYTPEEKKCLDHVVDVMIDYNLNYVQERTADGTYIYKMDPNLEEVVSFITKKTLPYANKLIVAKEIETRKMHRSETIEQKAPIAGPTTSLPNHLQVLTARTVGARETSTVSKDFFGRAVTKASSSDKAAQGAKNDIWYQYKEGYNNAVRKKIKISSLKK